MEGEEKQMITTALCVVLITLGFQASVLLCLEDRERIFTSHRRPSGPVAVSSYKQVESRSVIEAMVSCVDDENCTSFDYDSHNCLAKKYFTDAGWYQVSGRTDKDDGSECLRPCPRTYSPVCGSDGVTYSNTCEMEIQMCRLFKPINLDHEGEC